MKTRRIAVLGICLGLAVWLNTAQAQSVDLKFSNWVPPKHPLNTDGIPKWADSVSKASGGTIKVANFPAQQLGPAKDHYDMARDGIVDLAYINPGYQSGRFPVIAAAELPFLINNAKEGTAALDEWYRPYAAKEMGDVHYCFAFLHDPGTLHAKKIISRPDQIRGLKIRPAHATMANFVTLLGGSSVQVSAPESREALERGVADAITFPWQSIILFGIDKSVKFHMDAPFYVTTFVVTMNQGTYAKMNAVQKKAIDENCNTRAAVNFAADWADWEYAGRGALAKMEGHTVYPIGADDLAAWRKAAVPLRETWAEGVRKAGLDSGKVFADLEASLKKHKSAY